MNLEIVDYEFIVIALMFIMFGFINFSYGLGGLVGSTIFYLQFFFERKEKRELQKKFLGELK